MSVEMSVDVSSSTFINFGGFLVNGLRTVGSLAVNQVYAPEISAAMKTAEELGLGVELAYRVGLRRSQEIWSSGAPVHQIHGPVIWSLKEAASEALGTTNPKSLKSKVINSALSVGMAAFGNGTISSDWGETVALTRELGAKSIVLHPNGAEILYKNRNVIFGPDDQLVVAIEPDFKRMTEKAGVIYEPDEVIRITEITEQGVCLDTSHTGITYNNTEAMFKLYEKYKKEVKKGVVAIHFSVAIPGENRSEFFTSNPGTGARPLYKDTSDWIKGAYREFYQMVVKDEDFKGPFVLEMWSFPKGNSMDDRKRAVEETLEVLTR